jgi:hypothetical protein
MFAMYSLCSRNKSADHDPWVSRIFGCFSCLSRRKKQNKGLSECQDTCERCAIFPLPSGRPTTDLNLAPSWAARWFLSLAFVDPISARRSALMACNAIVPNTPQIPAGGDGVRLSSFTRKVIWVSPSETVLSAVRGQTLLEQTPSGLASCFCLGRRGGSAARR